MQANISGETFTPNFPKKVCVVIFVCVLRSLAKNYFSLTNALNNLQSLHHSHVGLSVCGMPPNQRFLHFSLRPNSRRTRTQIGMFFLWCCLRAVWTLPLTTTGPICLHCVERRVAHPVWIRPHPFRNSEQFCDLLICFLLFDFWMDVFCYSKQNIFSQSALVNIILTRHTNATKHSSFKRGKHFACFEQNLISKYCCWNKQQLSSAILISMQNWNFFWILFGLVQFSFWTVTFLPAILCVEECVTYSLIHCDFFFWASCKIILISL